MTDRDPVVKRERQREFADRRRGGKRSGQADLSGITAEGLRDHITAQTCPWCSSDWVFRNLGVHIVRAHGISSRQIKIAAGLPQDASLASQETEDLLRERWQGNEAEHRQRLDAIRMNGEWRESWARAMADPTPLQRAQAERWIDKMETRLVLLRAFVGNGESE